MEYRGYTITAEVTTYEEWDIDENGQPVEWLGAFDSMEVVGYHFANKDDWGDKFYEPTGESDLERLHKIVDKHIDELTKKGDK